MSTDAEREAIRRSVDIVQYISQYIQLTKIGSEFRGRCVFHEDHEPSLYVNGNKQIWACFACNQNEIHGSDIFGFVRSYFDCSFPEAIAKLQNGNGGAGKPIIAPPRKKPPPRELLVPPEDSMPDMEREDLGVPAKVWTILTREGKPWFLEARYLIEGRKETRFYTFGRYSDSDTPRWECKAPTNPRPFWGLEELDKRPNAQVMIHEAPKKAEAARLLLPGVHLGIIGGVYQVAHMDLTPLEGRRCILLPDNDEPGRQAMSRLAPLLWAAGAKEVKGIDPDTQPDGTPTPESWDIADAVAWTPQVALKWAKDHKRDKAYPRIAPIAPQRAESLPAQPTPEPSSTVAVAPSAPEAPPPLGLPAPDLILDAKGGIKPCEHNARQLMAAAAQYNELHFDDFLYRPRIGEGTTARDWSDHDERDALIWLQSAHRVAGFTLNQVRTAASKLAYDRRIDSLNEFVMGVPAWDGVARIELAFIEAWGAADTELTRAASRNFFLALHARAVNPGAQVDNLWVIEGPQGTLKSLSLRVLGGSFHAEITAPIGTTDFLRELRGIWIAELSELDSLRGREASTVKRLLSAPSDRFVDKYDKHAAAYPRRAVVVATTNEATYWQDSTGARRLIPIVAGTIRPDLIAELRLQWFAEARSAYQSKATWWEWPASMLEEQDQRQIVDPWEDTLKAAMQSPLWPVGWVSSASVIEDWLKLDASQQGGNIGVRIGRVMRRLGYIPVRKTAERIRGWLPIERSATPD